MKSDTRRSVPWLTAAEAAEHLGYMKDGQPNLAAFYMWKYRAKPKTYRLRGRLRFRVVDLDACVEAEPAALPASLRLVPRGR